ncbi:hypothetical protein FH972_025196 [Carpinus fangiana]|uniref:Amidohydrolase-related domain-containing protein n=1 Tax=Carpinus fangiana TaxID=176857 RepID=A0A5N6L0B1_9ROSI|nr:hypothetical protein FH972_025196 [Carpinus fangiana]
MAPLIDSHIHLWPASASNSTAHAWMSPDLTLTKPHELSDYLEAASQPPSTTSTSSTSPPPQTPSGVVYIETDRSHANGDDQAVLEAEYLGQVCSSSPGKELVKGIVLWCPVASSASFRDFIAQARQAMGNDTFDTRVKGFRYLFQGIHERAEFERVALGAGCVEVLRELRSSSDKAGGRQGYAFDVGVDQRSGGSWQLEVLDALVSVVRGRTIQGEAMRGTESAEEGCAFVLNHLCKPSFVEDDFEVWKDAISRLAGHARVYMKLSGAFSELLPAGKHGSADEVYERIRPWVRHVFKEFGASRIMFGSDWPVCNAGGPGEKQTWGLWRDVVGVALEDAELGLTDNDKARVWGGTAVEAYSLDT